MQILFTITAKQIGVLRGTSYNTARKEWLQVRDALALKKGQPLRLRQLAEYWGESTQELAQILYNFKG